MARLLIHPLALRLLTLLWLGIAAWLAARVVCDLRLLWLPTPAPSAQVEAAPAADLLAGHWRAASQAAPSSLPIQWVGAIKAVPIDGSVVVLRHGDRQLSLVLGDSLAPGLVLTAIDAQGLVFTRGDREERLPWPAPRELVGLAASGTAKPAPVKAAPLPSAEEGDLASLLRRIRATPVREHGELTGYRLQPGAEPAFFSGLGLEPGDVLRRVDAVPVADTRALLQRLPHWRATGALTLELERQGRALALPVRLSL
ncbi:MULTISPECIES: hypothetical protein [Pseudomonas]|jgi:type II secretion system protein C|uniref:hypothetical protein n=1 Tax=Pseudomonas TaxID=286 RepID=UPI0015AD7805|nr:MULTISPECIES: hypothetical protein [Pseudomonas]